VLTLGDNAYERGSTEEFARCYDRSWGRHRRRTHPSPGNHDYGTPGAAGYFAYFGDAAGDPGRGYYSFDLGTWHIVSLNSERDFGAGGAQVAWLESDLTATDARCTLAFWHRPRFSTGAYADNRAYRPFWSALYRAGADVVLNGHDHNYQRPAPLDPGGALDRRRGIREFVVGTGGRSHYSLRADPRRRAGNDSAFGVLKLTLRPNGYDWRFLAAAGSRFSDSGSAACH
jgi:hypothetical protein